jgi:hypothetical protein
MSRYQVLEITDAKDFCQCCGKKGLKLVVFIEDTETGEVKHFGTSCAVAPAKGFNVEREVKRAVAAAKNRAQAIASVTSHAYRKAGGKYKMTGPYSMVATDPELYAAVRAEIVAKGFQR